MMRRSDLVLHDALIEKKLFAKDALAPLLKEVEASGQSLQQILISRNLLQESEILNLYAEKTGLVCLDLRAAKIDKAAVAKVPVKIATYYRFMPIEIKDRTLVIAVPSPLDIKTQDEIRTQLGYAIETVLSGLNDILDALKTHYGLAADTLEKILSQTPKGSDSSTVTVSEKVDDIEKMAGEASVIKLVNQIILEAYRKRATDIHIEPYRNTLTLRYRIDGILYDANVPGEMKNFLSAIISRIKIMSNLNIVERRLPQDGRAVVKVQDQVLDLRISTIPTPYGESIVIRILPTQMFFSLPKLGLSKRDLTLFEKLVQKPHGIIFVTGPTGNGKTTTLYACLSRINTKERKIITIEDPIEYEMQGVTQIQVQPEIGLDFARGLRSILRHDPDVIMVGEVRDLETAEIAVRVALTGHLVLSTLHTNDAVSGITRLVDIGVEPYLVASSVEAFIAQRLIRVICSECKAEDKSAPQELKEKIQHELGLRSSNEVKIFRGKGCATCNFTGFYGRTAIYEIVLIDEEMKTLILKKNSSGQLKRVALSKGMQTLRQDGWQKVIAGMTVPEEVARVTSADEEADSSESRYDESPAPQEVSKPAGQAGEDKRIYSRLDENINLKYKVFKSGQELIKRGYVPEQLSATKNISAGGLLFISDEPVPIGAYIEVTIELPGNYASIECLAKVVRVEEIEENRRYDVAVCFLDISGADRARLNRYIRTVLGG